MFGLIFDCDGTLVDTEPLHYQSWQEVLARRGRLLSFEECQHLSGLSGSEIARKLDSNDYEALFDEKKRFYSSLQKKGVMPIERTVKFVKETYQKKDRFNFKFAVASAAPKEEILINLEAIGLADVFDFVISGETDLSHISDPNGVNKPKPYIYLHAAQLLGIDPKHCLAFEDTSCGIQSAYDAGLTAIALPSYFTKIQDFSKAHFLFHSEDHLDIFDILKKMNVT